MLTNENVIASSLDSVRELASHERKTKQEEEQAQMVPMKEDDIVIDDADEDEDEDAPGSLWESTARMTVAANVSLIVAPPGSKRNILEEDLKKAVSDAALSRSDSGRVILYYDDKTAGESSSRPWYRKTPTRSEHRSACLGAGLTVFGKGKDPLVVSLQKDVIMVLPDNNKDTLKPGGKQNKDLAAACAVSDTPPKLDLQCVSYHLTYDEESLRENRSNTRDQTFIDQTEGLHMYFSSDTVIETVKRTHYKGTSHGRSWGDLVVDPMHGEHAFMLPKLQKIAVLGPARVEVGGASGGSQAALEPPRPGDTVPMTYWSPPKLFFDELIGTYRATTIVDFTPSDGKFAKSALELAGKVRYIGVCHTAEHVEVLTAHLQEWHLKQMSKEGSPLYQPLCGAQMTKLAKEGAQGTSKPASTLTKNKAAVAIAEAPEATESQAQTKSTKRKAGLIRDLLDKKQPKPKAKKAKATDDSERSEPESSPPPSDTDSE